MAHVCALVVAISGYAHLRVILVRDGLIDLHRISGGALIGAEERRDRLAVEW